MNRESERKSKLSLALCFVSSLILGIIISAILVLIGPIFSFLSIFIAIFTLIMLSTLAYFSFSSFDIQESTILFLTIPISIIISATTFTADYFLRMGLQIIQNMMVPVGNSMVSAGTITGITSIIDISQMFNIWLLIALIIVIYNLPSIIFMLSKKDSSNSQ